MYIKRFSWARLHNLLLSQDGAAIIKPADSGRTVLPSFTRSDQNNQQLVVPAWQRH
jgi:hypothetical protein